jgi:ABC-type transporter MlaC component
MYDIYLKLKRVYYLKPKLNYFVNTNQFSLIKNEALMKYANESLKKSIKKIEDSALKRNDPNYKIKNIVARAVHYVDVDDSAQKCTGRFILGATYCFLLLLYINNANSR